MDTYFPTVPVEAARQKAHLPGERPRPLVLVVDDEPILTETLAAILSGRGLATLTASSAEEALDLASLIPPELLIADVAMPGISGTDLGIQIKRTVPDCEVILFSGQASFDTLARMRGLGHDFTTLMKPIHPADLLEIVFDRLHRRGRAVAPSRSPRDLNLYDFLSAAAPAREPFSPAWNVTIRQRPRLATIQPAELN